MLLFERQRVGNLHTTALEQCIRDTEGEITITLGNGKVECVTLSEEDKRIIIEHISLQIFFEALRGSPLDTQVQSFLPLIHGISVLRFITHFEGLLWRQAVENERQRKKEILLEKINKSSVVLGVYGGSKIRLTSKVKTLLLNALDPFLSGHDPDSLIQFMLDEGIPVKDVLSHLYDQLFKD